MRVIINGALGRMGAAVLAGLADKGITPVAQVDPRADAAVPGMYTSLAAAVPEADVLIDFSAPSALCDVLAYAQERRVPAVLATTGYTEADNERIKSASEAIGLFRSANMSLGINLLSQLIARAAQVLGDGFDAEIVETHHNKKKDAPSGTALMLADALQAAYADRHTLVYGRQGAQAGRVPGEIGIHALRGGTVPGTHEVHFFGMDEVITLSHTAQSRSVFATGAIHAAAFLVRVNAKEHPGLYDMASLLTNEGHVC